MLDGGNGHVVGVKATGRRGPTTRMGLWRLPTTIASHPWNMFRALGQTHSSLGANVSASWVLGIVWLRTIWDAGCLGPSAFNAPYLEPGFRTWWRTG